MRQPHASFLISSDLTYIALRHGHIQTRSCRLITMSFLFYIF